MWTAGLAGRQNLAVPDLPAGAPDGPLGRPVRGVLLDLDGTVYLGQALIPGAGEAIRAVKGAGVRVAYLTNKPLQPRGAYAEKLTRLGVATAPPEVVTSSSVLARWLRRHAPGATLFVIGEPPLLAELSDAGFALSDDPPQIEVVVAAFDRAPLEQRHPLDVRAEFCTLTAEERDRNASICSRIAAGYV